MYYFVYFSKKNLKICATYEIDSPFDHAPFGKKVYNNRMCQNKLCQCHRSTLPRQDKHVKNKEREPWCLRIQFILKKMDLRTADADVLKTWTEYFIL